MDQVRGETRPSRYKRLPLGWGVVGGAGNKRAA